MSSIGTLNASTATPAVVPQVTPANASAELAKYESQLADWVHCASSKTSAGKAKIAEINDKIQSIKAQVKLAEETKLPTKTRQAVEPPHQVPHLQLRLDQQGTWLDVRA